MGIIINPRQIIKDGLTSLRDVWSSSKVSTELSGKQATLVSGTNIKTINGNSLLGSGDITISGGGDIPKINMTATTATLDPNKFYVWGEVASLDISLAAETAGIENVYKFQFQSGATATTLTLPSSVTFDGERPSGSDYTYIISIESNIAKIERKMREALLPSAYQQVEYIQSTGTQYINTGVNGEGNLKIKAQLKGVIGSNWGFGSCITITIKALLISNGGTSGSSYGQFFFAYGSNYQGGDNDDVNDGTVHTYIVDAGSLLIDDNLVYSFPSSTFSNNQPIFLFALNNNGTKTGSYLYSLYSFSIKKEDDNELCKLVPCYRIADNVAGMYDIVRDVFLTNAGAGSFIVGPDV